MRQRKGRFSFNIKHKLISSHNHIITTTNNFSQIKKNNVLKNKMNYFLYISASFLNSPALPSPLTSFGAFFYFFSLNSLLFLLFNHFSHLSSWWIISSLCLSCLFRSLPASSMCVCLHTMWGFNEGSSLYSIIVQKYIILIFSQYSRTRICTLTVIVFLLVISIFSHRFYVN